MADPNSDIAGWIAVTAVGGMSALFKYLFNKQVERIDKIESTYASRGEFDKRLTRIEGSLERIEGALGIITDFLAPTAEPGSKITKLNEKLLNCSIWKDEKDA